LNENIDNLCISDFSLHSIGVILFRKNCERLFLKFANDVIPKIELLTLPINKYPNLLKAKDNFKLDFDDAYQFNIAKEYNLKIVTIDKDFKKVENEIESVFL